MHGKMQSLEDLQRQIVAVRQEGDEHKRRSRQLEAALRASDLRYRALLYNLPDKVFHKDRNSIYVSCNRNYAADFGLEPEQMVGKTDYDLFPHHIAEKYRSDDSSIMSSGRTEEIEEVYCTVNGGARLIRTVKTPLRDEKGQITGILGIFSDITERMRAEDALRRACEQFEQEVEDRTAELWQANEQLRAEVEHRRQVEQTLRESEQRMQMALETSRSFAFEWEVATDRVLRSDSCSRVLGLSGDEARHDTGQSFFQRIHREDRARFVRMLGELRPSANSYRTEYRVARGDDTVVVLEETGRAVFDSDGKLQRLVGVTTDITERKQVESELRESESKYKALVESSPNAVIMSDLNGIIVFASRTAARQHGFDDPRQMLGRSATEFVVADDRDLMKANMQRLLREKIRRNQQYRGLRCDGTTFFGDMSASVITGPAGEPQSFMAVYQDITDRKRAEEALRGADAELLAVERIQAYLLPREAPRFRGFDIAGHCYSAKGAAGDHFDFLLRPDGSLLIVLADVSGHGLGPALVAANFCARLRTLSDIPCDLKELVEGIHAGLYRETAAEDYVTAILGRLDGISHTFSCINAGHPPAIVLDAEGREKARIESTGLPFAILEVTPFVAHPPVTLRDGDLLFFYTDGLTEAHRHGDALFGLDRAVEIVRDNQHLEAAEIVAAVHDVVCEYIAPEKPTDDITVVIVKVLGSETVRGTL